MQVHQQNRLYLQSILCLGTMPSCSIALLLAVLFSLVVSTVGFLPAGARWMMPRRVPAIRDLSRVTKSILSVKEFDGNHSHQYFDYVYLKN